MRISDWSSDVCSSDLPCRAVETAQRPAISGGRAAQDIPRHDAPGLAGKADRAAPDLYPPPRAARSGRGGERDRRRRLRLPARKGTPLSAADPRGACARSEEHQSEIQSLMRISYAVFCLK